MRLSLLDRMLLFEMLRPLGVGLLAILQLLVLAQLLQLNEVVFGGAVSLFDLWRVTTALAPHFLVTAIPLAYMLGVQLALGRMAADQEVLALSAAGRGPLTLYRVPIAIALALGVGVAGLARWAEPWGLRELNRVLNDVIKRNLESGVVPGVFNDGLPRFMIYVASAEQGKGPFAEWRGVLIEDAVGDGAPMLALAEAGRIEDAGTDALSLKLERGELHRTEAHGETVARFKEGSFLVGVQDRVARGNKFHGDTAQVPADELAARADDAEKRGWSEDAARMRVELVRRWAVPLACLAFALLGVPLAVAARGVKGSAYLTTLGAFVAFYSLSRLGVALAERGLSPWLCGFLPDLAVAALGLVFTVRLAQGGVGKPR